MKKIYFVRHGESISNTGDVRIGMDAELSKKGIEQAKVIAERCTQLGIDLVVTSTMKRSKETAEIINGVLQKPIESSDLFVERKVPTEFSGVSEEAWNKIRKEIKGYFYTKGFRHSDEENFEDIMVRCKQGREYLVSKTENNILVVTHGSFLRDFVSSAIFKDKLTPEFRREMTRGFTTVNTGLTILTYKPEGDQWSLLTWNDHAHLG